jgi:hypothetical protein
MTKRPRRFPDDSQTFDIERQLRRLPAPEPSPELERRLLAGIPEFRVRRAGPRRYVIFSYALATSLAIAVIFSASFMIRNKGSVSIDRPHPRIAAPQETSPEFILGRTDIPNYQETRPCDILPPLVF